MSGDPLPGPDAQVIDGFRHYPELLDGNAQRRLVAGVRRIIESAPLYTPRMPRTNAPFSVRMTNCGPLGWVSDRHGYRYQAAHPATGKPWPKMPDLLLDLWQAVSDYPAPPEACLVNYYAPGARLGSHRDTEEADKAAPVVSVSLGDDAIFHIGGLRRADPRTRIQLRSGDVVVLGGTARLAYHGVDRIVPGTSGLLAEGGRFNLTLRRVNPP